MALWVCLRRTHDSKYSEAAMIEVRLSDTDSLERALKVFKKKLQKSGLLRELRRRRHYVKPSEARALKTAAAQRRARKKTDTKETW
jgi:small subunit ribosomal protein S21